MPPTSLLSFSEKVFVSGKHIRLKFIGFARVPIVTREFLFFKLVHANLGPLLRSVLGSAIQLSLFSLLCSFFIEYWWTGGFLDAHFASQVLLLEIGILRLIVAEESVSALVFLVDKLAIHWVLLRSRENIALPLGLISFHISSLFVQAVAEFFVTQFVGVVLVAHDVRSGVCVLSSLCDLLGNHGRLLHSLVVTLSLEDI